MEPEQISSLINSLRQSATQRQKSCIDFDDPSTMTDADYWNLTGLTKDQFSTLIGDVDDIRTTKTRSIRTCIALLLVKLRTSLGNALLSTLFNMTIAQSWIQEGDVVVVDRGFRDASTVLEELGVTMQMPSFMRKGSTQHTSEESNKSRLVTKIRWVVESTNGRLKTWTYLARTMPNTQVPFIGDYVRIVGAICNRFRPALSSGDSDQDKIVAERMLYLSGQNNDLQQFISDNDIEKITKASWKPMDELDINCPIMTEDELRCLIFGVYTVKLAASYTQEHMSSDGIYSIHGYVHNRSLLCLKFQSRHVSRKQYRSYIRFKEGSVDAWFCSCPVGARVVGTCAHVTSALWYLCFRRHQTDQPSDGPRNWAADISDAANVSY
ncbi:uncharacterized protein LOC127880908 isoform X1 [Dreissena polymorpha]|nr:uncharacterized protein LOC127880908 isoform X1 [Dreissena polymorpha]